MLFTPAIAAAVIGYAAAVPVELLVETRSSSGSTNVTVSMGDNNMDWGTDLPSSALNAALNAQCVSGNNQCDTESYTYGTATSVAQSYKPGGSGAYISQTDNLVFQINGDWANEQQRGALIGGMAAAIGAATANNSFYDTGSPGNAYTAATPGGEFLQYNAPTFVGVSIISGSDTIALMNAQISAVSADNGWCDANEGSIFAGVSTAVGAVPVAGSTLSAVFGFISTICSSS